MKQLLVFILLMTGYFSFTAQAQEQQRPELQRKCLYINSYHQGYEWSDGIEKAALKVLKTQCSIQVFYMDTKRNNSLEYAQQKGLEAKAWIEAQNPNVVIVADDAAVEHVLVTHFKDKPIKFVFCGVNWDGSKFGLPYRNATGIIEVSPVEDLFKYIKQFFPKAQKAIYFSGNVDLDRENYQRYKVISKKNDIDLKPAFSKNMIDWQKKYLQAQTADVVIVANHAGIADWSSDQAKETIKAKTQKVSVTNHEFMSRFSAFSVTKISQEQGEWAGKVAIELLNGTAPEKIPVAVNRKWNIYVNDEIVNMSKIQIPDTVKRKASKVSL